MVPEYAEKVFYAKSTFKDKLISAYIDTKKLFLDGTEITNILSALTGFFYSSTTNKTTITHSVDIQGDLQISGNFTSSGNIEAANLQFHNELLHHEIQDLRNTNTLLIPELQALCSIENPVSQNEHIVIAYNKNIGSFLADVSGTWYLSTPYLPDTENNFTNIFTNSMSQIEGDVLYVHVIDIAPIYYIITTLRIYRITFLNNEIDNQTVGVFDFPIESVQYMTILLPSNPQGWFGNFFIHAQQDAQHSIFLILRENQLIQSTYDGILTSTAYYMPTNTIYGISEQSLYTLNTEEEEWTWEPATLPIVNHLNAISYNYEPVNCVMLWANTNNDTLTLLDSNGYAYILSNTHSKWILANHTLNVFNEKFLQLYTEESLYLVSYESQTIQVSRDALAWYNVDLPPSNLSLNYKQLRFFTYSSDTKQCILTCALEGTPALESFRFYIAEKYVTLTTEQEVGGRKLLTNVELGSEENPVLLKGYMFGPEDSHFNYVGSVSSFPLGGIYAINIQVDSIVYNTWHEDAIESILLPPGSYIATCQLRAGYITSNNVGNYGPYDQLSLHLISNQYANGDGYSSTPLQSQQNIFGLTTTIHFVSFGTEVVFGRYRVSIADSNVVLEYITLLLSITKIA